MFNVMQHSRLLDPPPDPEVAVGEKHDAIQFIR
jgi:hypothetical protein